MAKKKVVKKKVKKKQEPIPQYKKKFKCLACGAEYEAVSSNNITNCPSCSSMNTNRIG